MINSNFRNVDELTSYDRFLLSKKEHYMDKVSQVDEVVAKKETSNYEEYLINELRRTTPPKAPLMREDEYLVKCTSTASAKTREKRANVQFKKYGKIILTFYVIFVLALAFIVIGGSTTDITSKDIAGAAKISESSNVSAGVSAMNIEEEQSEESNWFDRLCDSLNK